MPQRSPPRSGSRVGSEERKRGGMPAGRQAARQTSADKKHILYVSDFECKSRYEEFSGNAN